MKSIYLRFGAGLALLAGTLLWLYGGARAGFYRNYYEVVRIDEVTGLEYPAERVETFLPGIETLVIAFAAFVAFLIAAGAVEARAANRKPISR